MNPQVIDVEPLADYKLRVHFENKEVKEFDTSPYLEKGIFQELKDVAYFQQVRTTFGTVEWPNQQDFSSDTLYLLGKPE